MNLTTIQSEGSLISADLLPEIYAGTAPGQQPKDFGLTGSVRLTDEIAACWSDARAYYEAFQHGLRRVREEESGASVTREQWVLPLLRTFGFEGITFARTAAQVGGQTYFISHRLGDGEDGLPIHIEGARNSLDARPPTGRPRLSPHALVQEYLNRTGCLWGIVTNGEQFRILRDAARLSRPTYLEFNLRQMKGSSRPFGSTATPATGASWASPRSTGTCLARKLFRTWRMPVSTIGTSCVALSTSPCSRTRR